jgi:hypothetical protein
LLGYADEGVVASVGGASEGSRNVIVEMAIMLPST